MNVCAFKIESIPALRAELLAGVCCVGNLAVGGHTPVLALCRALIAAGHNPATPLDVYRGNTLALQVYSIGEAARLAVDEHNGTRFAKWKPFCRSAGSPRIAQKLAAMP
jgi:hypothetical protein